MYPVSLADLMTRTLQRANVQGNDSFIGPPELIGNINQSISEWIDEVRMCTWAGQYFRSRHTFTTVPQTSSDPYAVGLPPDFVSMTSVDVYLTINGVVSALPFQEEQRTAFRYYPTGWLSSAPIYYQIWGQNIVFIPAPTGAYQVRLNYVPTAPILSAPTDTIDSINGLEEFVVLNAAIMCLIKLGDSPMIPILQSRLEQQRERIRATVPRRDMSSAEVPHIVQFDDSGGMADW